MQRQPRAQSNHRKRYSISPKDSADDGLGYDNTEAFRALTKRIAAETDYYRAVTERQQVQVDFFRARTKRLWVIYALIALVISATLTYLSFEARNGLGRRDRIHQIEETSVTSSSE